MTVGELLKKLIPDVQIESQDIEFPITLNTELFIKGDAEYKPLDSVALKGAHIVLRAK